MSLTGIIITTLEIRIPGRGLLFPGFEFRIQARVFRNPDCRFKTTYNSRMCSGSQVFSQFPGTYLDVYAFQILVNRERSVWNRSWILVFDYKSHCMRILIINILPCVCTLIVTLRLHDAAVVDDVQKLLLFESVRGGWSSCADLKFYLKFFRKDWSPWNQRILFLQRFLICSLYILW